MASIRAQSILIKYNLFTIHELFFFFVFSFALNPVFMVLEELDIGI